MSDGHELVSQEHGALASVAASFGALLMAIAHRLLRKEGPKESKEQREKRLELERQLAEADEKLLDARFAALRSELISLITAERMRIDNLQHENGSQGERLAIAEKDINNLWRRQRGEEPRG